MTPATFRALYRQFKDPSVYSDAVINLFIGLAGTMLNATVCGASLDYVTGLFVAHYLTVKARDDLTVLAGGVPGEVKGPLTQRSVDTVSNTWDTKAVSLENGGFWNLTVYGVRFLQLARQSPGALQL